ncbi:MAG: FkbM family methyltransferase [Rhodospirillaceae bacterium]|nr:FkbM family methyltransferase [Rhodospirillaceae bacterium]
MNLSFHHVGGRWGTIPPLNKKSAFYPIIDVTLYEPDVAAAEKIQQMDLKKTHGYASVNVQTSCLGEENGTSDFHLCFDRSASSMLPFDPAYSEFAVFRPHRRRGIYKLGTAHQSTTIQVDVHTLASLIDQKSVIAPDILSIDAEGAGYPILKGLGEHNLRNTLALFVEAPFIPYRIGEASFPTVFEYLSEEGFFLFELGDMSRYSLAEMHLGGFDRGPCVDIQDALFLRNPSHVIGTEALKKLALIAILYGALSVAHECFKKLERFGHTFKQNDPSADIGTNCLGDFYNTYTAYKNLTLPKLDEMYNAKIHNHSQYTDIPPDDDVMADYIAQLDREIPKYTYVLATYTQLKQRIPTHDALYQKYGLGKLAEEAKAERLRQEEFLQELLLSAGYIKRA